MIGWIVVFINWHAQSIWITRSVDGYYCDSYYYFCFKPRNCWLWQCWLPQYFYLCLACFCEEAKSINSTNIHILYYNILHLCVCVCLCVCVFYAASPLIVMSNPTTITQPPPSPPPPSTNITTTTIFITAVTTAITTATTTTITTSTTTTTHHHRPITSSPALPSQQLTLWVSRVPCAILSSEARVERVRWLAGINYSLWLHCSVTNIGQTRVWNKRAKLTQIKQPRKYHPGWSMITPPTPPRSGRWLSR